MNLTIFKNTGLTREDTILFKDRREKENWLYEHKFITSPASEPFLTESFKVKMDYIEALECDYIQYRRHTNDKVPQSMFYFITDIKQLSDAVIEFSVELDTITTFLTSDWSETLKSMRIEREHMEKPNNTNEPMEAQEFIDSSTYLLPHWYTEEHENYLPVVITVQIPNVGDPKAEVIAPEKTPSVIPYALEFYLTFVYWDQQEREYKKVLDMKQDEQLSGIEELVKLSANDKVVDISILPFAFDEVSVRPLGAFKGIEFTHLKPSMVAVEGEKVLEGYELVKEVQGTKLDGTYVYRMYETWKYPLILNPKNKIITREHDKKLYNSNQYTEVKLEMMNTSREFDPSHFLDDGFRFEGIIAYAPETQISITPMGYALRGSSTTANTEYSIPLITNEYMNYMNNERHSRNTRMLGGIINAILSLGLGLATGGLGLAAGVARGASLGQTITGEKAKQADLKNLGQQTEAGGSLAISMLTDRIKPRLSVRVPSDSEQKRISEYFNLYGYANNRYGLPKFVERDFNYLKGGEVVFNQKIPVVFKNDIEERLNNGIRFWDKDKFLEVK